MKRTAYIFLLIFLPASCTRPWNEPDHTVRIFFMDSTYHTYALLSVRDSSLLAVNVGVDHPPDENVIVIPFSKILYLSHHDSFHYDEKTAGGIVGFIGGAVAAVFAVRNINIGYSVSLPFVLLMVGGYVGAALGMLIGDIAASNEKFYYMQDPFDRLSIKEFARFRYTEPPVLQKIK